MLTAHVRGPLLLLHYTGWLRYIAVWKLHVQQTQTFSAFPVQSSFVLPLTLLSFKISPCSLSVTNTHTYYNLTPWIYIQPCKFCPSKQKRVSQVKINNLHTSYSFLVLETQSFKCTLYGIWPALLEALFFFSFLFFFVSEHLAWTKLLLNQQFAQNPTYCILKFCF